jgi:hypothetical protein
MKKTGWKVSEGGRVVTRRQLEHSLNQLAQTFIKGLQQLEEHFDARLKQLETNGATIPAQSAVTSADRELAASNGVDAVRPDIVALEVPA